MQRFLVCSGIHSRPKSLDWLEHAIATRQPDGVLFAGGVLDSCRPLAASTTAAASMTRDEALFVEKFFQKLGSLGVFSAIIPGLGDVPLEEFLRIGMHAEIDFPNVHIAHATFIENSDIALCGIGGLITADARPIDNGYSLMMAEYHLRPLASAKQPHRILLLPTPPTGPLGGDEGHSFIGDLVDSYHPNLCVVGGPSARRGTQRIASSLIINPGCLAEGCAAWFDWSLPAAEQVEFVDVRHGKAVTMAELGVYD